MRFHIPRGKLYFKTILGREDNENSGMKIIQNPQVSIQNHPKGGQWGGLGWTEKGVDTCHRKSFRYDKIRVMFDEGQETSYTIPWPVDITPEAKKRLHNAASTQQLPETIVSIMTEEAEKLTRLYPGMSRLSSDKMNPEFMGHAFFIADMERILRLYRSEGARSVWVRHRLQLDEILKQRFGDDARAITEKDHFDRIQQAFELLKRDPSGLELVSYLVRVSTGSRQKGVMIAANRYKTLCDSALDAST